ncbi:hypothetical protein [Methylotuvimicrobium buryatense]|uniref:Multidrug transporter n=1 Tax=Methylotuvimicrobium buryatense TaxID=95641 RepID=A0A4P9ULH5_METBY|nr:hypothetical protein [Methylotuvimicrobium buryatense]QCW80991.1 hypothetical protein EQU24_01005 [Methylotuvimicrobium buryatense]
MRTFKTLAIIMMLSLASPSFAQKRIDEPDGHDVLLDVILLRPIGFVGLIAGTVSFIATSPFTAIATIPKPHDAFSKMAKFLIVKPAKYTFVRQAGDLDYEQGFRGK